MLKLQLKNIQKILRPKQFVKFPLSHFCSSNLGEDEQEEDQIALVDEQDEPTGEIVNIERM